LIEIPLAGLQIDAGPPVEQPDVVALAQQAAQARRGIRSSVMARGLDIDTPGVEGLKKRTCNAQIGHPATPPLG